MKKNYLQIILALLFFTGLQFNSSLAQNQIIRIQLTRPPPNMLGVGNLWKLDITNSTSENIDVYLTGTVAEEKDGLIVDGRSKVFTVKPGKTTYGYNDFKSGNVNWKNKSYEEAIMRTGNVKSGSYTICVTAFFKNGEVADNESCIDQKIELESETQISLIQPGDGDEINVDEGIFFTWAAGDKGPFKLVIVEIRGEQSPDAAIKENHPFFEQKGITIASYQYPLTGQKFEEDKKYAWGVESNGVWSDIWRLRPRPRRSSCNDFKVNLVKNSKGITGKEGECCYDISINNNISGINKPFTFKINTDNSNITSAAGVPAGWTQIPPSVPPNTNNIVWYKTSGPIPSGITNLGTLCFENSSTGQINVKYELRNEQKIVICKDSVPVNLCGDSCKNNLIRNGGFVQGNAPGQMPSPGAVQYWARGYGIPIVDNNPSDGFIEQGYIKLSGNVSNGQSVMQSLDPGNKIIQGKYYKLSVAVRFLSSQNTIDYVKIRAIAFNGNIYTTGGSHPPPSSDVAIISRSGKIHDCSDWSVIEFPVWKANKDFLNIAINAFTNDNSNATVLIDDVILCETTASDCDEVQLNSDGMPIIPSGYGNVPSGFTCEPEAEGDDYYNGSLQDLYPGYNGTSDIYTQGLIPCPSIGGTIPDEVNSYNCDDSLKAAGINMTCDELQSLLDKPFEPPPTEHLYLPPIPTISNSICDTPNIERYKNMPFHGRDIIYVHGLQLNHIVDRASGQQGATGYWPGNVSEFYNMGYYHTVALQNMLPHIDHFIRGRGNKNRFIIVSYDCSESAEVAVHCILSQIREAMENGKGVEFDPSDPRKSNCFGRDYVFVSHSTGAIIADVALSIANKTKTDISLKTQYGDIGLISDRCRGRVSIQGAYSGSNLAKIVCMLTSADPLLVATGITAMSMAPLSAQTITSIVTTPSIIFNSVLVDLVPAITRNRWSSYINDISVPVFTFAGGHPSVILGPLKYVIHPGFDDGVLTMDCANGNNNSLVLGPSCFSADPIKVIDMGIPLIRRIEYFLDQKRSFPGVFAAASTLYLSPTGMVEPVSSIIIDPQNHFNNHFSFVQSSKEHWFNATELGSGNIPCDYKRTSPGGYTNNEEELVVTNPSLFTPGLIDPSIISQMGETLKDYHIWYPWIKIVFRHGFPRITVFWKKFYIWKRTYHTLNDNCMYDVDYAYKYLFKQ